MLPHYVEAYKATDEGRGWAEEEEQADSEVERQRQRERECLWSSVSLSVILYPNHAATQTNMDRQSHRSHKHTHTHQVCIYACFPDPLSPYSETLKCGCQKGCGAWQPSAALEEDAEDRRAYCVKGSNNNKRGSEVAQSDRRTWCVQTLRHLHCLVNTGAMLSRAWILQIRLSLQRDSPGRKQCECVGICA